MSDLIVCATGRGDPGNCAHFAGRKEGGQGARGERAGRKGGGRREQGGGSKGEGAGSKGILHILLLFIPGWDDPGNCTHIAVEYVGSPY